MALKAPLYEGPTLRSYNFISETPDLANKINIPTCRGRGLSGKRGGEGKRDRGGGSGSVLHALKTLSVSPDAIKISYLSVIVPLNRAASTGEITVEKGRRNKYLEK